MDIAVVETGGDPDSWADLRRANAAQSALLVR
jgi:hypothetical protein